MRKRGLIRGAFLVVTTAILTIIMVTQVADRFHPIQTQRETLTESKRVYDNGEFFKNETTREQISKENGEIRETQTKEFNPTVAAQLPIMPIDKSLPTSLAVPIEADKKWLTIPFMAQTAGLGNKMFEIVALLGMANSTNRMPLMNVWDLDTVTRMLTVGETFPLLMEQLNYRFINPDRILKNPFHKRGCCRYDDVSSLKKLPLITYLQAQGIYFQSFKYFEHIKNSVIDWLQPADKWKAMADRILPSAVRDDVVICVHGRRGDFMTSGIHMPTKSDFTRAATEFVVDQYIHGPRNITVVLLSNDQPFMESVFVDVATPENRINESVQFDAFQGKRYTLVIPMTPSANVDLGFASQYCHSVLLTAPASTFGWWLAYLAKNGTSPVYYYEKFSTKGGIEKELNPPDFFPGRWHKLRHHSNWTIEQL